MNLADITTKCYILALIIRDDGERLLLGDGAYEFKDSQQHFIANTYANDVVELQGTDGQMLAGQVRRTATQTFAGYIGDATFSKQKVEEARRDFLMFFRKKHYYTAVYVFSDGTAIQRDRGYIVNAPSVPELYQRFPEWSIGLNFEDPNYYEYAEDDLGHEIAAHKVELELSTTMSGGLIWDGDGSVSDDLSYVGTEIEGEGKNFQLADTGTATLKSAELLGDATQSGTPTPDSPVPVQVVTGEQIVEVVGKNLFNPDQPTLVNHGLTYTNNGDGSFSITGTSDAVSSRPLGASYNIKMKDGQTYTISANNPVANTNAIMRLVRSSGGVFAPNSLDVINKTWTYTATQDEICTVQMRFPSGETLNDFTVKPQVELGSTATAYEPYQGQTLPVNLGKNLFDKDNANVLNAYLSTTAGVIVANSTDRVVWLKINKNSTYTVSLTQKALSTATSVDDFAVGIYTTQPQIGSSGTRLAYTPRQSATADEAFSLTFDSGANEYVAIKVANISKTDFNATLATLQLELGSATSYAPYFTPIELAKIGTYQDRIYKTDGKWYIEKQVGKVVLDGSETWEGLEVLTNTTGAYTKYNGILQDTPCLSNYFVKRRTYGDDTVGISCRPYAISLISLRFSQSTLSAQSITGIKTWLSTHNTTVYYALATPTTTEITNSELVGQLERLRHSHTYADTTNFSITAISPNLPAFLKVVAFGDDATPQGGYVWEDGGTGGATTITVDGVDNAQPIWTVVGPATNPSLTNITTGESIQWTGVVPNGQTLVVNMADMTASLSGANVFEFISGSWITLQAGNNRVSYSATAATGIATLEWNGVVG